MFPDIWGVEENPGKLCM